MMISVLCGKGSQDWPLFDIPRMRPRRLESLQGFRISWLWRQVDLSHISFLGTCLCHQLTPVGFRIHFPASQFGPSEDPRYSHLIDSASRCFSRRAMRRYLASLSQSLPRLHTFLSVCNGPVRYFILRQIHACNRCFFDFITSCKDCKIFHLQTPEHGLCIAAPGPAVDLSCPSNPGHVQNLDSSTINAGSSDHGLAPAVDLGCPSNPGHIQNLDSSTINAGSHDHGFAPAVDLGCPSNPGHIENLNSSTTNAGSSGHGQLQSDCATTNCGSSLELQAGSSHAAIVIPISPSPTTTLQSPLPQIPSSAPGPSEAPSSSHPNPSLSTDTTSFPPPSDPISHPCRVFTIPSDLQLSEAECSVLSKGLTFVPLRPHLNEFRVCHDAELFFRRLCLRVYFFGKDPPIPTDDPFSCLQPSSSSWTSRSGLLPALDLFIANCQRDNNRLDFTTPCSNSNQS
ncbi:uncharacterized protein LOC132390789 [Hypanus sabinus]|uniref:uncharacterized protein LOC132390789 n=1 Tax=Hypanus sabinus TaxID=79690 RepID=UPI0028C3F6D8|nr:uncharacterized protein LOC132390789 [Hypanus sabinus]